MRASVLLTAASAGSLATAQLGVLGNVLEPVNNILGNLVGGSDLSNTPARPQQPANANHPALVNDALQGRPTNRRQDQPDQNTPSQPEANANVVGPVDSLPTNNPGSLSHDQFDDGQPDREEVQAIISAPDDPDGIDPPVAIDNFYNTYYENTVSRIQIGACNTGNIAIRKEWGTLSAHEQTSFISAFQCLHSLPAKTNPIIAPGARSRLDDFVVPHVTQLLQVHRSPLQLPWHRHYLWKIEKALQDECGFTGTLPFWDWSKYLDAPWSENPIFDGSATSLSGNGVERGNCTCVESGPLANWTVNLDGSACSWNPQGDLLGYNPRCLERKFDENQMTNMTYENVAATLRTVDIQAFTLRLDAPYVGLHSLPHTFIGGAQNSIPGSASDPWFFLHHSMLDRTWAIWQAQDFARRETAIITDGRVFDPIRGGAWGVSPDMGIGDLLAFGVEGNVSVVETLSPVLGGYCYIYGR